MPRVGVLVGKEPTVGIRDLARSARARHQLVFFCAPDLSGPAVQDALRPVGDVRVAPRQHWSEAVGDAAVDGLTTFDDALVEDLERVTCDLDMPGASGVSGAWDKLTQRRVLNEAGASDLKVLPVSSMHDLAEARASIGPAGVLKPRRSSTSRGVVLAMSEDETSAVWKAGLQSAHQIYEQMMEFETGVGLAPFVSVETVSVGTERVHFACTDKLPLVRKHLETGHVMPSGRDAEALQVIRGLVTRALDALDVRDRVTHTEVGLTSTGPQVIEVNGRLGGFVNGLARRTYGLDACRMALDAATRCVDHASTEVLQRACAAALLPPLETDRESDVEHALRRLRGFDGVRAVESSSPVTDRFRRPVAWVESTNHVTLQAALAATVRGVLGDEVLSPLIDSAWARDVLSVQPPRHP